MYYVINEKIINDRHLLIVGLGNPGRRYEKTRHNAGWLWLDSHFGIDGYKYDKYGNFYFKQLKVENTILFIVKPQTFMNVSGTAVSYAMRKSGISESETVIVHDDFDLESGKYKYSTGQGSAGHNGVISINKFLPNNNYWRLRLGVRPIDVPPQIKASNLVLKPFSAQELLSIEKIEVPFKSHYNVA